MRLAFFAAKQSRQVPSTMHNPNDFYHFLVLKCAAEQQVVFRGPPISGVADRRDEVSSIAFKNASAARGLSSAMRCKISFKSFSACLLRYTLHRFILLYFWYVPSSEPLNVHGTASTPLSQFPFRVLSGCPQEAFLPAFAPRAGEHPRP